MAKYVNINAAKEAVRRAECDADWDERRFDAEFIENALDFIPAADVASVVHWRWNADETCSVCGEKSTEGLDATKWNYWFPNYCPNCGAKMDGETEGNNG